MATDTERTEIAAAKRDPEWLAVQADTIAHEIRRINKAVFLFPVTLKTAADVRRACEATALELDQLASAARSITNG